MRAMQRGEAPSAAPSAAATAAVALGTTLLAFCALGFGRNWTRGVIGGGDAWQNLWNVEHVRRWVCDGQPLFFTTRLFAPEGASLATHTLSLPFSLPAALAARVTGLPLAYNLAVLLSFAVAGAGVFRLARRLGAGNLGATAAALCFAFCPPRFARAYGHLNLLGLGFLGFALEGLVLTGDERPRARWIGATEAALALAALVYADLYLALLGALAASAYVTFALRRERARGRRALVFVAVATAAAALSAPLLVRVKRDLPLVEAGHPSKWCSVALTSLVIPSRIQALSAATAPLTEKNHQNLVEGVGYLGWIPLIATVALFLRRPAPAARLPLGQRPRRPRPEPRSAAARLRPAPRGATPVRVARARLPRAAARRLREPLRAARAPRARGLVRLLCRPAPAPPRRSRPPPSPSLFVEYVPWRIPVETWPLTPADPALEALARDRSGSVVLDVEGGTGALVRQLVHGHPLVSGYLSRNPLEAAARRRDDPVLRMLGNPAAAVPWSADEIAAHLELRFHTRLVVAPDTDAWTRHLESAGLVLVRAKPRPHARRTDGRAGLAVRERGGATSSRPRSTSRAPRPPRRSGFGSAVFAAARAFSPQATAPFLSPCPARTLAFSARFANVCFRRERALEELRGVLGRVLHVVEPAGGDVATSASRPPSRPRRPASPCGGTPRSCRRRSRGTA